MAYAVPIATPQPTPQSSAIILPTPDSHPIAYDVGAEFPNDPFRLFIAWANCFWVVAGVYKGT